uniref:KH domain-containing protein n=1 Tax=Rhabditophanes sp. KR3021 TaxID=114890 RepID=A0AC35TTM4_9BILA
MEHINNSVKNSEFTAQLANNIFLLCQQLKIQGNHMEQTHKIQLNKVFVSLRQACCRDNGQLGTPCRLKIMELVELKAMGWRPNLNYTQYYINNQHNANENKEKVGAPMSAPPYSSMPVNSFNFVSAPTNSNTPMYVSSDQTAAAGGASQGFYIIPASSQAISGHFQQIHNTINGSEAENGAWHARAALFTNGQNQQKGFANNSPESIPIVHMRQKSNNANKTAQIREEVVIRNADSGKIMGVKGRRIAVVEELSKTIVSFQKVDPKSRDRILTITGTTQESIDFAKKLIEETIRRNISPNRDSTTLNDAFGGDNYDDEDNEDMGIKIETGSDGTLKLCCANPKYLEAAQVALSEYLNRVGRTNRLTNEERELKKERRKSMPLSVGNHHNGGSNNNDGLANNRNSFHQSNQRSSFREKRNLAGSVPNLVDPNNHHTPTLSHGGNSSNSINNSLSSSFKSSAIPSSSTNPHPIRYSRHELQAISETQTTPATKPSPNDKIVRLLNETIPEITRTNLSIAEEE